MTALAPNGQTTRHRYSHSIRTVVASAPVGGPRRCPLPASLEGVGGPGGRTGPVSPQYPGLTRLSETAGSSLGLLPAERRHAGRAGRKTRAAGQTPPGNPRPFIVGRAGEGGTEAGTQPGRTWATPTPWDASRRGQWRRARRRPWARSHHAWAVPRVEGPLTARGSVGSVPVGPGKN
jgi:hypothetical protein